MQYNNFLDNLSSHILEQNYGLTQTIIVLPNKRAKVFLLESYKNKLTSFTFAPKVYSIEDFVQEIANIVAVDSIELLFEFYEVYLSLTKTDAQTFDQFSNWAKTVIQDFNEIDRYLKKPNHVFSYLEDIEVIKRWGIDIEDKTKLIENYIQFWKLLPQYYESFYNHLKQKGVGYQGLIYREAVHNIDSFIATLNDDRFIFAGFNALNAAEEIIFQKLLNSNNASVFWDVDTVFLQDKFHDAGLFVRKFKSNWPFYKSKPFDWTVNCFSEPKNINIIGTSKSVGQAKIVFDIINNIKENNPLDSLNKVAIVLGDENLLIPVLHSLPENVGSLNITMGYPSKQNPIQLLVAKLFKLHSAALSRSSSSYVFYYKDILDVLTNPSIETFLYVNNLISVIKKNNFTFISQSKLFSILDKHDPLFALLFAKWDLSPVEILDNIISILLQIRSNLNNDSQDDKVSKTFLYSIFQVINKLHSYCFKNSFIKDVKTLQDIYNQIIDLAEVSFEGEPLSGLQIMGVLESRVLDFDTVIITSMNEGKFPAGKATNSFIPFDVKCELELPTFKEKDAIYTYHFYHLLLRAKNIFLLYNTENDGLDGGEKSRIITQIEFEKQPNHNITHDIIQPQVPTIASEAKSVNKSELVVKRLADIATGTGFSPSALTAYIRNPMQFYFQKILSIRESDDVEENIEVRTLGTIIHKTLEELYKPYIDVFLTIANLDSMLMLANDEVFKQFTLIYKEGEIKKGRNLLAFEVAKRNVTNFLALEKKQISNGDAVKVIALEVSQNRILEDDRLPYPVKIAGNVDRIELRNNKIRIIDYKTGKVDKNNVQVSDWTGLSLDIKNEKIIQILCYAFMYENQSKGFEVEAGIVSFKNLKTGFLPFGFKQNNDVETVITADVLTNFTTQIIILINEILDKNVPFLEK